MTSATESQNSSGAATLSHMVGALVESKFGLSLNHVPYQGAAPALIDVLAGRVDVLIANWSESRENIAAGKLKLIAILGSNRVPELPNVQTANEAFPELGTLGSAFQGIVIPAGTPQRSEVIPIRPLDATISGSDSMGTPSNAHRSGSQVRLRMSHNIVRDALETSVTNDSPPIRFQISQASIVPIARSASSGICRLASSHSIFVPEK